MHDVAGTVASIPGRLTRAGIECPQTIADECEQAARHITWLMAEYQRTLTKRNEWEAAWAATARVTTDLREHARRLENQLAEARAEAEARAILLNALYP